MGIIRDTFIAFVLEIICIICTKLAICILNCQVLHVLYRRLGHHGISNNFKNRSNVYIPLKYPRNKLEFGNRTSPPPSPKNNRLAFWRYPVTSMLFPRIDQTQYYSWCSFLLFSFTKMWSTIVLTFMSKNNTSTLNMLVIKTKWQEMVFIGESSQTWTRSCCRNVHLASTRC